MTGSGKVPPKMLPSTPNPTPGGTGGEYTLSIRKGGWRFCPLQRVQSVCRGEKIILLRPPNATTRPTTSL